MLGHLLLVASLVAVGFGQSCNPDKLTAPCTDVLPCETGSTCDTTLEQCCLNADLITTTAASGTTVSSASSASTVTGSTVTSQTSSSSSSPSSSGCVDKTNAATGVSDCAARKALCNDTVYYDVMTQQCPKTCGRCSSTTSSTSVCEDLKNPKTGTSDCSSKAAYCNDSNYAALMRTQCPKTCGFCGSTTLSSTTVSSTTSSGTCVDKVNQSTGKSDCAANKVLCNNSAYQNIMRAQCPKTCGFC